MNENDMMRSRIEINAIHLCVQEEEKKDEMEVIDGVRMLKNDKALSVGGVNWRNGKL